jgi:hypothetical protein
VRLSSSLAALTLTLTLTTQGLTNLTALVPKPNKPAYLKPKAQPTPKPSPTPKLTRPQP